MGVVFNLSTKQSLPTFSYLVPVMVISQVYCTRFLNVLILSKEQDVVGKALPLQKCTS